ncbi:MAG: response regulator [Chloroflexi bacterium]|nr:response regulator [Chloroflexota bacterium]MBI3176519.1 response regulator [Chloroflexota bacterium]MBI5290296.1 response regulator [Chloroflexota bacterium]MBI5829482.1 response regulator [Chloroflexota bacterium]
MAEKQSILIVEDDGDLAEMLNAYFRVQGYDVLTAAWGEDAIKLSQQSAPDIILLDIRLPDIDGYEVCRRLRSNRRTESLPIIFLTERRDRVDKLQGLELGVVDYITKPFDIQELRLRVRNALRRAKLETLVNPVTGLPEGKLVDEQLQKIVASPGWTALVVAVRGLQSFRELYGFVAADDVLRAVSLMINNVVREVGGEGDFVGHFSNEDFIVITPNARAREINERIQSRVTQSMDYFYPLRDREPESPPGNAERLSLTLKGINAAQGSFEDLKSLKAVIQRIIG